MLTRLLSQTDCKSGSDLGLGDIFRARAPKKMRSVWLFFKFFLKNGRFLARFWPQPAKIWPKSATECKLQVEICTQSAKSSIFWPKIDFLLTDYKFRRRVGSLILEGLRKSTFVGCRGPSWSSILAILAQKWVKIEVLKNLRNLRFFRIFLKIFQKFFLKNFLRKFLGENFLRIFNSGGAGLPFANFAPENGMATTFCHKKGKRACPFCGKMSLPSHFLGQNWLGQGKFYP